MQDPDYIKTLSKVEPESEYSKAIRLKNKMAKIRGYHELEKLLETQVKQNSNNDLSSIVNSRNK